MVDFSEELKDYDKNGFAVIHNFLTQEEVDEILKELDHIVQTVDLDEHRSIITPGNLEQEKEYFFNSADKTGFFFEEKAFDDKGNLVLPRSQCLQKLGHGIHLDTPCFKRIAHSERVQSALKTLGKVDPAICQSILVFKNPHTGSEVAPHKDAEFLYTEPEDKLIAFWFAFTDVTLENGCLEVLPGSHKGSIERRFTRTEVDGKPKAVFDKSPIKYDDSQFIPVTVPRGACLIFDGKLAHKSRPNNSPNPRPAYVLHIIDQHETKWGKGNWLQMETPFPRVYG